MKLRVQISKDEKGKWHAHAVQKSAEAEVRGEDLLAKQTAPLNTYEQAQWAARGALGEKVCSVYSLEFEMAETLAVGRE